MNRRGVTAVELVTVLALVGLLASIAVPTFQRLRRRAQAADALASMVAIRTGAFGYNGSAGSWPSSAGFGRVPPGLAPYLPGQLDFRHPSYRFAWRTAALRLNGRRQRFQSVQARTGDPVICQALAGLLGGRANTLVASNCRAGGGTVIWFVDQ